MTRRVRPPKMDFPLVLVHWLDAANSTTDALTARLAEEADPIGVEMMVSGFLVRQDATGLRIVSEVSVDGAMARIWWEIPAAYVRGLWTLNPKAPKAENLTPPVRIAGVGGDDADV